MPLLLSVASGGLASAQSPLAQAAAPAYPACAKSSDIDGKGTFELFGTNGWIFESHEFKANEALSSRTLSALTLMAKAFKARGSHLILVPVPTRAVRAADTVNLTQYPQLRFSAAQYATAWTTMIAQARSTGVYVVDLLPTILNFNPGVRGEEFFYPRDHHWTLSGTEAAARQVTAQIQAIAQAQGLELQETPGLLEIVQKGEFTGPLASHYTRACGTTTEPLKRFQASYTVQGDSLLGDVQPLIGIYGDSFGLTYPDNKYAEPDANFAVMLEATAQLPTINNSVSGSGKTATLAGYLALPEGREQLPPFVVVPFMGGIPNNTFDYGQVTAALIDCSAATRLARTEVASPSPRMLFAPPSTGPTLGKSLIHIHTNAPTNYIEVREGRYTDNSVLSFEIYRIAAPYYFGSRTDFYSLLADDKTVNSLMVQLDKQRPVSGYVETCKIPDTFR
ncbi:hypothetical protein [Deinococcus sp. Arct2-2]|uniref:alginate O-acetyltransferase AlgX-related protein n=1 Tax=Deinococcus sp. Arct2-2 TaxID=2568653 RepID=UPI001454C729|nr:hypothetical protein [Deinococcus sp. Arct2-2]